MILLTSHSTHTASSKAKSLTRRTSKQMQRVYFSREEEKKNEANAFSAALSFYSKESAYAKEQEDEKEQANENAIEQENENAKEQENENAMIRLPLSSGERSNRINRQYWSNVSARTVRDHLQKGYNGTTINPQPVGRPSKVVDQETYKLLIIAYTTCIQLRQAEGHTESDTSEGNRLRY
jgi:hypothetical protein